MILAELIDDEKELYHEKARRLVYENKIFGEEWKALHRGFMEEFYGQD